MSRSTRILVPLLALAGLASCTSWETRLHPEREIPILCTLAAKTEALPARETRSRRQDVEVVIEELGTGNRSRAIVLIHGVLSDRRTWRYLAGELGRDYDLILVDLPGCGASSVPDVTELDADGYTPTWLADQVLRALDEHLGARDVQLTVVGHSLGGAVALRMLGDERLRHRYSKVIERVDGGVLLAPLDFAMTRPDPTLIQVAGLTDFDILIGMVSGLLRRSIARAVYEGCHDPATMPREEMERVYQILIDDRRREAAQAMIRRAAPLDERARPIWSQVDRLVADYANVDVPCLILWGGRDETLPVAMGYKLHAQLPSSRLLILREAMHSLPIEEPLFCNAFIRRFVTGQLEDRSAVTEFSHVGGGDKP